jgi:hypothetical protein
MRCLFIAFIALFSPNFLYSQAVVKIEKPSRNIPSNPNGFNSKATILSKSKPYFPKQLFCIELIQKISFDAEGKKKQYELQKITIKIPATINIKGVELPICTVNWAELKKKLLADKRAMIHYKGKEVNLVNLLENREFLSIFYVTGFLEP